MWYCRQAIILVRRLVLWINHLPPACWSTFWKSNFKQQLGCRFDIMDNESYFFVFWHMQLYVLIHQIIFRFYLLKYSLFFSSNLVLTSSIDVVFILSILFNDNLVYWRVYACFGLGGLNALFILTLLFFISQGLHCRVFIIIHQNMGYIYNYRDHCANAFTKFDMHIRIHSFDHKFFNDIGVWVTKPLSPFRNFPNISALCIHTLEIEYHVYIWLVSPQLS